MEQVNTVEKSHEQIQLRSLTRNIAKGSAPKRKLSFVDNRPIQQKQVQMKEVIQRKLYGEPGNMCSLINNQRNLQDNAKDNPNLITARLGVEGGHANPRFFTTVGYEFEFIQLKDQGKGSVLQNVIHAELGKSTEIFGYTGLPFTLETDSTETIELVTPPFIIDTLPGTSIPEPDDVQTVSTVMETDLGGIAKSAKNMAEMRDQLNASGLFFPLFSATIKSENMIGSKSEKLASKPKTEDGISLNNDDLFDLDVMESTKLGRRKDGRTIATQVNIAMTAEDYLKVKDMPPKGMGVIGSASDIAEIRNSLKKQLSKIKLQNGNINAVIEEIAVYLGDKFAILEMERYRTDGIKYFKKRGRASGPGSSVHNESRVKDFRGVWFKDSIRSLLVDLLQYETGSTIEKIAKGLKKIAKPKYEEPIGQLCNFLEKLANDKLGLSNDDICTRVKGLCEAGTGFGAFDARPDTYFPSDKLKAAPGLSKKRLHVVESRYDSSNEIVERLKKLKEIESAFKKMEDKEGNEDGFKKAKDELIKLINKVDSKLLAIYNHRIGESVGRNDQLLHPYD